MNEMIDVERRDRSGSLRMFQSENECRGFWRIGQALGCKASCVYCYLRGTLRFQSKPVLFLDKEGTQMKVANWLKRSGGYVLNAGELCDSLCWDDELRFIEWAVPMFEAQDRHVLLLLSKFDKIDSLLRVAETLEKPIRQTIVSWSISAMPVWSRFELGTSDLIGRLVAAGKVKRVGYRVRLRIDPMIPINDWPNRFADVAQWIKATVEPERVTLGSLRFKPRTAGLVRESGEAGRELIGYLQQGVEVGRYRIECRVRETMYERMACELRARMPGLEVALCKETEEFRQKLGLAGPCHCEM